MSQPLVSVIIPTYNYGRYVGQAVDSALAQSYRPLEVIVVDDGSTDDTKERLAKYGTSIRNIHQLNQGLSAARNTGIREAHGEYLAFLDSDDAFHPRKLELQMAYILSHPGTALVATEMFSDEPLQWCPVGPAQVEAHQVTLEEMAIKPRFAPSSVVAHRNCFESVGMFDTELKSVEDRDMWLRIAPHYTMARLNLPLTWYRTTPGSMSTHPERMEHFELKVLHRALAAPRLRSSHIVRRQALSHCYRSSAYTFHAAGRHREAAWRILQSLWYWPWFYAPGDAVQPGYRLRLLKSILLGMLRRQPLAANVPVVNVSSLP